MSSPDPTFALGAVDRFIAVGNELADVPLLGEEAYRPVANDLYEIALKLGNSSENIARLLYQFLYFDFRASDAREKFLALAKDYRTTRAGVGFQRLKYNCGDIRTIYSRNIEPHIDEILANSPTEGAQVTDLFNLLGQSDADMVAFIHEAVEGSIDEFLDKAVAALNNSQTNAAEAARLQFMVDTATISERLERLASGLADLVIRFAALAQRKVELLDTGSGGR